MTELRVTSKRINPNIAARALSDDAIAYYAANSHAYYIRIRTTPQITVSWMPKYGLHCCMTCRKNECAHVKRVAKWQETNPPPPME